MSYEDALKVILKNEGGYVNDPFDRGGATNKGVTQSVYDNWRIAHSEQVTTVACISDDEVAHIYRAQYWNPAWCEKLPDRLALIHFDAAVNHGVKRAVKLLQTAVGAGVDGAMGSNTMKNLETALAMTSEDAVIDAYLTERAEFYEDIVERDPTQVRFLTGWMNRISSLRKEVA